MKSIYLVLRYFALFLVFSFFHAINIPAQRFSPSSWIHHSIDSLLPGNSYGTSAFTLADFDKDGDLDITISRREILEGQVYWYENQRGKWIRHNLGISDELQLGAVSLDINNDGYPDLVVARYWFENPKVLDQYPDSLWQRHTYEGGLPSENHDIISCDFNNDGREEILAYSQNAENGTLRIYDTGIPGQWKYHDVSTQSSVTVKSIVNSRGIHGGFSPHGGGDLDGDSYADIVMPAGWYRNPGTEKTNWQMNPWPFHTGITPSLYGISMRSWITDLDSDGDNDIVYTDCDIGGSEGYWIENIITNGEFIRHALPSPGEPTGSLHSLAVADFDGDGDLDIFTGEQEDPDRGMKQEGLKERGFFWENTGSRTNPVFKVRIIQTDNPGWHEVQTGDVDGDGDIDIVSKVWNKDGRHYHADYWENRMNGK